MLHLLYLIYFYSFQDPKLREYYTDEKIESLLAEKLST